MHDPHLYHLERHTTQDLRFDNESGKPCMIRAPWCGLKYTIGR
jgi:hypothetical protein